MLKIIKKVLPVAFCLLILCCNNTSQPEQQPMEPSLRARLVGTWKLAYLKVKLNTFNNTDSTGIREVKEENWETDMQRKPIITFYKADGTYNSEHRDLRNTIVNNPAGRWMISGDSIVMIDTFPTKGVTYRNKVAVDGNVAEFWGVEDFDHDGHADDNYYGLQKRQ